MTLFGSNKNNNNNTNDPNDVPRDGGFGRSNLAKHDQAQGHAGGAMHNHGADDVYGANTTMEPTYGGNSGIRGHDARAGDRDAAMLAGQGQRDAGVNDRDFAMAGNGGGGQGGYSQGQGQGYNDASNMGGGGGRGMGMQGGGDYATSNERGMGGQTVGYGNEYGNQNQGQNQGQMGGGGGGGFISDSHAQRLYRDGEERRLQSQQQPGSGGGNMNSGMGVGSGGAGVGGAGTQTMNPTTATNPSSSTNSNTNTQGIPHNSQSLATQAEQKARESDAMQKQAVEVSKAEELEKAAMAARNRAVEHGAHPLHGHQGGLEAAKNRGTQA